MLAQYQQGSRGLFGWWGKPLREPGEKPPQACTEQANRVDITKHKCRDIGLPDGMGVPNRQADQGDGSTGTTLSGHCTTASETLIFWRHIVIVIS